MLHKTATVTTVSDEPAPEQYRPIIIRLLHLAVDEGTKPYIKLPLLLTYLLLMGTPLRLREWILFRLRDPKTRQAAGNLPSSVLQ